MEKQLFWRLEIFFRGWPNQIREAILCHVVPQSTRKQKF